MSQVSCNGCSACCRQHIVRLSQADEANLAIYDWREVAGVRVLKTAANGDCIHLGSNGCTIYERRPQVCRVYDCRKHFSILSAAEQKRFAASALGVAARQRLATLDADDRRDLIAYRSATAGG